MKTSADGGAGEDGDPAPRPFFHEGMRAWQDRFDSRRLADRLEERLGRKRFTDDDRAFIQSRTMFFLATADAAGRPDCSYKGGDAGFVRITGDDELAVLSYDGNGMFRSIGNLSAHAPVGLLFIETTRCAMSSRARNSSCACAPRISSRTARATSTACNSPKRRPTCRVRA